MSGESGLHVVDADGHLAEGQSFGKLAFEHFPDKIGLRTDGIVGLAVEGRNYPKWHGPGAGCPPGSEAVSSSPWGCSAASA